MAFICSLASKTLHVGLHANTISFLDLLIYLPSVYLQDVLLICLERILLHGGGGVLLLIGGFLGAFISYVKFVA